MKKLLSIFGIVLGFGAFIGGYILFWQAPVAADKRMNPVIAHAPYKISPQAAELHQTLAVVDLHADTMLWMRNLLHHNQRGHVDLPRLQQGGVTLQVFSSVTKSPKNLNYQSNDAHSDNITLLAFAQRWPVDAWFSIYGRAKYQARRLNKYARESKGNLRVILTQRDLQNLIADRQSNPALTGGILSIEGAHPLEGKLENIDGLYGEGYRMMGLQHFFDNELGGSLHGITDAGLTPFGRDAVKKMAEMNIIIDVAHSSEQVVRDVLALTDKPVIVSHTGIRSLCETKRNIHDEFMAEIAARGGLIGIGYWKDVTCDASPDGIAKVIIYAAQKFGVTAIALGSDYDGTITTELDTSELAAITDALLRQGMSEEDIRKVMGENALRFFAENLPA